MNIDKHYNILLIIIITVLIVFFIDIHVTYRINSQHSFKLKPDTNSNLREKAEILYDIKKRLNRLVEHMKTNKVPDEETALRLYERFKNTELRETSLFEWSAGYTINKGQEIRVCLSKLNGKYQPNLVMFILLHEMAHIMSASYGHNQEFQDNMEKILKIAVAIGVYIPRDFSVNPAKYCGVVITNSPCNYGRCL